MREIRFRAWHKGLKKMFQVGQVTLEKGIWNYEPNNREHIGVCIPYQPSFVLMQYIGLHDKNGKEIFEGDIVEYANNYRYIVCFGEYNINPEHCAKAIIVGFYLKSIEQKTVEHLYSINEISSRFPKHCAESEKGIENLKLQLIGNIYDNPNLLEEGEQR